MSKITIVAGVVLALGASAGAGLGAAQAQTPPAATAPRATPPGPPGDFGPRFERGRGGPWQGRGWRHGPRLTPQEIQKRNADAFARMDANKDGKVSFEEYRQDLERRRLERQREVFQRFSGGKDSFTLEQLNARSAQRFDGRGRGGRGAGDPGFAPRQDARPAR